VAEGDTIHRLARQLDRALVGRVIDTAAAPAYDSPLRPHAARLAVLEGARLGSAEARGKHLLLHFEHEIVLHCHLGMRGFWRIEGPSRPSRFGARPARSTSSAWIVLSASGVHAAQFGGRLLALRTEDELRRDRRLLALGPDILAEGFRPEATVGMLRSVDQGRELGDALLDQTLVAGIGNVYKSEGCHAARVDPWSSLAALDDEALRRVLIETRALMSRGLVRGREPRGVYRRAGRPCGRCRAPIRSRGQGDGNRTTYWCPRCQSPGGAR
jgi:endonuclease-8